MAQARRRVAGVAWANCFVLWPQVEDGPQCNICQKHRVKGQKSDFHRLWQQDGRTAHDLLYCSGGCGAQVHPLCAGFTDDHPPPDPWRCPVCDDED